jgi:recombination protein RecA
MQVSNVKSIDVTVSKIEKKYGKGAIMRMSDATSLTIRKVSSGCTAIDLATLGGFPEGRASEVYGMFSTCKTTLMILAIRQFLLKYPKGDAHIVDPELAFDADWMAFMLDTEMMDRVTLLRPADGEEACDMVNDLVEEAHKVNVKRFIGMDSLASLIPTAEKEDSVRKKHTALHPRMLSQFLRKFTSLMRQDFTKKEPLVTVLFTNQSRMKIGILFGNPETAPGGHAKEHFVSVRIALHAAGHEYEEFGEGKKKIKESISNDISFNVDKNKCHGPQKVTGRFTFHNRGKGVNVGGTFNNEDALLNYCLSFGYAKENTKGVVLFGYQYDSIKDCVKKLKADPDLFQDYVEQTLTLARARFWRKKEDEVSIVKKVAKADVKQIVSKKRKAAPAPAVKTGGIKVKIGGRR